MGRLDEAREVVGQLRTLTNVVVPGADNWRDPIRREFYLSDLRLAFSEMGRPLDCSVFEALSSL